jgi:hypothetical protein
MRALTAAMLVATVASHGSAAEPALESPPGSEVRETSQATWCEREADAGTETRRGGFMGGGSSTRARPSE